MTALTGFLDAHIARMATRLAALSSVQAWLAAVGGSVSDIYITKTYGTPTSTRWIVLYNAQLEFQAEAIGNGIDPKGWTRAVGITFMQSFTTDSESARVGFLNDTAAIFAALMAAHGIHYGHITALDPTEEQLPALADHYIRDLALGEV